MKNRNFLVLLLLLPHIMMVCNDSYADDKSVPSAPGGFKANIKPSTYGLNVDTSAATYSVVPCGGNSTEQCLKINLSCVTSAEARVPKRMLDDNCKSGNTETIMIPNGRPIYAFLVSGYHQNRYFNLFHWYRFAQCLHTKGAYVHFSWWNNFLAPYMAKPLHNPASKPSHNPYAADTYPGYDLDGFLWPVKRPTKGIPADDFQFQKDAKIALEIIRKENPTAAIILVGHSMGGASIARLAASTSIDINLVAPIDPVGNRTCIPYPGFFPGKGFYCRGHETFRRYFAVHWPNNFRNPEKIVFGKNIKYLYHRWQNEARPPFLDYTKNFYFDYSAPRVDNIAAGTHIQKPVGTDTLSHYHVPDPEVTKFPDYGKLDGHGEIVGFRGVRIDQYTWPLGLAAKGKWPDRITKKTQDRINHLKAWEKDPFYLYKKGFEPYNPNYCMVSGDLCNILDKIVQ